MLKKVVMLLGLVSAAWALLGPVSGWLFGVDRVVYDEFPEYVESAKQSSDKTSSALHSLAETQRILAESEKLRAEQQRSQQVTNEMLCEDVRPQDPVTREWCRQVLHAKRLRESAR